MDGAGSAHPFGTIKDISPNDCVFHLRPPPSPCGGQRGGCRAPHLGSIASPSSVAGRAVPGGPSGPWAAAPEEQGAGYRGTAQRCRRQPRGRGGESARPGFRGPCRAGTWRGASGCPRCSWRRRPGRGRARVVRRGGGGWGRAERCGLERGPVLAGDDDCGEQAISCWGRAPVPRRSRRSRDPAARASAPSARLGYGRTAGRPQRCRPVVPEAVTGASVDGAQQPHAARRQQSERGKQQVGVGWRV